ncbi:MAG: hypothetical protein HY360_07970 [Verrucomicrobia bacterium]|nr:hypothetical protein [Verrucomicrobiota bacterium]
MTDDPIVAEVRRARDKLARKFNYDIHAIFDDLRRRQGKTVTIEELHSGPEQNTPYSTAAAESFQVRETK